ncbi:MAG: VanZ family protein [Sedimentisphaerales bacterium]|nr:VanZ family protein [Sedimentisphaerales bacterium]
MIHSLSRRQKITIILLALYWSALFILAHIQIPQYVRKAHVSDKSLHFLAYFVLTFLLWFAIRPDEKVNWRKFAAWLVLLAVTGYGAVDEVIQSFVGRTLDPMDITANLAGTLSALLLSSFFFFWPGALIVTGIVIFGVTNFLRANLADILPVTNCLFFTFAYGTFSSLWIYNIYLRKRQKPAGTKWLKQALAAPVGLLIIAKILSAILGRPFAAADTIASAGAIATVTAAVYLWNYRQKKSDLRNGDI